MGWDKECKSCLLNNLHYRECNSCDDSFSSYIKDPRPENKHLRKLLEDCLAVFDAEPEDATIAITQIRIEIKQALKGK